MKVNKITKTKTIEEVEVTYIADDGTEFKTQDECKKYEESALFIVNNKLKRLTIKPLRHYDLNDMCPDDEYVEVFDIQTEQDLDNLKQYIRLILSKNEAPENSIMACFNSSNEKWNGRVLNNITVGHEVLIFWNYECDCCWTYLDGSIDGYLEFLKKQAWEAINSSATQKMEG